MVLCQSSDFPLPSPPPPPHCPLWVLPPNTTQCNLVSSSELMSVFSFLIQSFMTNNPYKSPYFLGFRVGIFTIEASYHHWALSIFKDVSLKTRRALSLYNVYGNSALLVFNGTSLNIDSALLALNWQNVQVRAHFLQFSLIKIHVWQRKLRISQPLRNNLNKVTTRPL